MMSTRPLHSAGAAIGRLAYTAAAGAVALCSLTAARPLVSQPTVALRPGLVITQSVRITPGVYAFRGKTSTDSALIVIRGDNIVVDFQGAELRGIAVEADPDGAAGVAIRVDGGRNIEIRNAHVRGYRVGILAVGTRGLKLTGNTVSYNWKPRLFSVVEHESLVDWMSFHKNENREWLRFGAAIYLEQVVGGEIRGNTAEQGSNGLLMTRTDSMSIHDNSLSFNSALGIGLYRSSNNQIYRNRADYNVRGYSHGFFRRGQDSAALLMYEQSSNNFVANNSMTHSGDGLFLWAGQSTMDTGQGGANDNLFLANDFSYAPTNGIEATFSRNDFIENRVVGSDHGLWGGYSFDSRVLGNCFQQNRIGVAIEHGQGNQIAYNVFAGDSLGISLWANSIEPSDWGYPKYRDTRSRDYQLHRNQFLMKTTPIKLANTSIADSSGNAYTPADTRDAAQRTQSDGSCTAGGLAPPDTVQALRRRFPTTIDGMAPSSALARRGRDAIVVDEWGPYDWRFPKVWPIDSTRAPSIRLRTLGPPGSWRVSSRRGLASISRMSGLIGDTIVMVPDTNTDAGRDWAVSLQYTGGATVNARGTERVRGAPVTFSYEMFEPRTLWNVQFFVWSDSTDPRTKSQAFQQLLKGTPVLSRSEPRLDYMWYRPTLRELPQTRYAVVATSRVTVPAGVFSLRTISDDAIRVWIDGGLAIDHWTPHESAVNYAPIAKGTHTLRVEYAQAEGWTELKVEVVKGAHRGVGTAGPH